MVLSWLPEPNIFPSGQKATDSTEPVCFLNDFISSPVTISQIFIVLSLLPDAKVFPSGLNDMELI